MILTDHALVMPDRVIERLELHLGESLNWQPLSNSGTRHNLFFAAQAHKRWIARVAPDSPLPPGVDPPREAKVIAAVASLEQALKPSLNAPELGLMLMPDYGTVRDREQLSDLDFEQIVLFIKSLQAICDVPPIRYEELFGQYRELFSHAEPGLVQLVDETERALALLPNIGQCLVHHDLHVGNLLWSPKLHVIDWEYAGLGNPWLDYASLVRDLGFKQEQLRKFDRLHSMTDSDLQHSIAQAIEVLDQLEAIWQRYIALKQPQQLRTTLTTGEKIMSDTKALLEQLESAPQSVEFEQVMAVIAAEYVHTPSAFTNGDQTNSAEQNQGSCKILGFARLNGLSEEATLNCFGKYYREDVLQHPEGSDHGNIRAFMRTGWSGVDLPNNALSRAS